MSKQIRNTNVTIDWKAILLAPVLCESLDHERPNAVSVLVPDRDSHQNGDVFSLPVTSTELGWYRMIDIVRAPHGFDYNVGRIQVLKFGAWWLTVQHFVHPFWSDWMRGGQRILRRVKFIDPAAEMAAKLPFGTVPDGVLEVSE